jgi:hypothetical protein
MWMMCPYDTIAYDRSSMDSVIYGFSSVRFCDVTISLERIVFNYLTLLLTLGFHEYRTNIPTNTFIFIDSFMVLATKQVLRLRQR